MITREVGAEYPLYLPEPLTPRSPGIHISSIIRCIATETGILKPNWAEELSLADVRKITDPVAILRISLGLAWEQYYIPLWQDVVDHPEEMQVDGVYMSKDGESVSVIITPTQRRLQLIVHECKATYKSTKTVGDLSDQWMWLAQLKAYCKGTGTRFCRLHVLFFCGDYKFPLTPQVRVWEIEFTQAEIEDNWDLLMEYKNQFLATQLADQDGVYRIGE